MRDITHFRSSLAPPYTTSFDRRWQPPPNFRRCSSTARLKKSILPSVTETPASTPWWTRPCTAVAVARSELSASTRRKSTAPGRRRRAFEMLRPLEVSFGGCTVSVGHRTADFALVRLHHVLSFRLVVDWAVFFVRPNAYHAFCDCRLGPAVRPWGHPHHKSRDFCHSLSCLIIAFRDLTMENRSRITVCGNSAPCTDIRDA